MLPPMNIQPAGPKPSWAPNIKPEMQAVIEKLVSYGDSPLVKLSAVDARKQHSPADAVKDLMQEHNISAPVAMSDTSGKNIDVQDAKIHLRIYTPKSGDGLSLLSYIIMAAVGSLLILIRMMPQPVALPTKQAPCWYQWHTGRPPNLNFLRPIMIRMLRMTGW